MNYLELRSDGWLIGSGMVESGAKQFKDRFSGAGMRWSRNGAQNLLPIRSAIMSNRFNARWRTVTPTRPRSEMHPTHGLLDFFMICAIINLGKITLPRLNWGVTSWNY